ncbi:MAG: pyrroloquinoline quinone biosynthesis peptide chaperone PqqD [Nitrospirae bacterium]|nr:pyrroloquinoline quinone biosynthesis peptide chaperone PqqD [Nitrospirota bacterium]
MGISKESIPFRKEDLVFRKIEDEYILVPLYSSSDEVEHIFNLNATGAEIWERIDGTRSVEEIIEELKEEYDHPSGVIEKEVLDFLHDLYEAGIIEVREWK